MKEEIYSNSKRSLRAQGAKFRILRQSLGWTQEDAAIKAGYSIRLIRKLESGGAVRPATLVDVLQCYHEAAGIDDWEIKNFLNPSGEANSKSLPRTVIDGAMENGQNADTPRSIEQQRQCELMQTWYETIYHRLEVDRIREFVASDILFCHGNHTESRGVAVVESLANTVLTAFGEIKFQFDRCFAHEGQVFLYWNVHLIHTGPFNGVAATGRRLHLRGSTRAKIEGRYIVEVEDQWDVYDLMRQINDEPDTWQEQLN